MKPKPRSKAKSLGQVAFEAHWPTALFPWDRWNNKPAWHRVARAVVAAYRRRNKEAHLPWRNMSVAELSAHNRNVMCYMNEMETRSR